MISHWAACCVTRLLPSAALARAMAAIEGATNPALAVISVSRAVSWREVESRWARASC